MPRKILIVDDEAVIQKLLEIRLSSVGYRVASAADGSEALKMLENFKPDLILLDINMPKMGGIAFYDKICGSDGRPTVPVIVLTGRSNLESLFKDLEADGFVSKPFKVEDLLGEVERVFAKRAPPSASASRGAASRAQQKVLIGEDGSEIFDKIVLAFVRAGYLVSGAKSAVEALQRAEEELPDIGVIKLSLKDLPGDVLAIKLTQILKTSGIRIILYSAQSEEQEIAATNKICRKMGFGGLVLSEDPALLLKEAENRESKKTP